jgi:UDP-N-acetylmuramoyl-L-alanyl-D-glutamate--2,6-diaminopimelate ligase
MPEEIPRREAFDGLIRVGVTGTNGKTSTTDMLAALLSLLQEPVARSTTLGYFVGQEALAVPPHYPGFVAMMQRCLAGGGRYAVLELTSEALARGFTKSWPCRVAAFTNLSIDHSDAHGSLEHYLASKAQLFMTLEDGGTAVLNGCDSHAELLTDVLPPGVDVVRYGVASRGEAWAPLDLAATAVEVSLEGTSAELSRSERFPDLPRRLQLRMIGHVFVENALAALGAALALGVDAQQAVIALSQVPPPPGRFEVVTREPCVIVDYAHTPDALARTLATARELCRGRLTVVFGAGGDRDRLKRPLLGAAAKAADRIVLTSDNPRSESPVAIIEDIARGVGERELRCEVDREAAIRVAVSTSSVEDVIVIAGKGHEQIQHLGDGIVSFSDVAIVRSAAKSLR